MAASCYFRFFRVFCIREKNFATPYLSVLKNKFSELNFLVIVANFLEFS